VIVLLLLAWARLPALAERLPAPDAAAALAQTTRALHDDPVLAEELEPDVDVLARVAAACRRIALSQATAEVRLDAMECAANLGDTSVAGLLLHVDDPTVRAGAVGFVPIGELYDVIRNDTAPLAAGAAAAVVCTVDPAGAAARLGDEGRARLKLLAADATLDPGYRRAIRFCPKR
jgi:hypothetical protein